MIWWWKQQQLHVIPLLCLQARMSSEGRCISKATALSTACNNILVRYTSRSWTASLSSRQCFKSAKIFHVFGRAPTQSWTLDDVATDADIFCKWVINSWNDERATLLASVNFCFMSNHSGVSHGNTTESDIFIHNLTNTRKPHIYRIRVVSQNQRTNINIQ